MESIKAFVDFLDSYETWAKVLMLVGFAIIVTTLIFAPKKGESKMASAEDLASILKESSTVNAFKASILVKKELFENYLKKDIKYDELDFVYNLKVDGVLFDFALYYHNNEMTQIPHFILLIDLYELSPKQLDWSLLDNNWHLKSSSVKYDKLKKALERTNGFNSPLEYQSSVGGIKPRVVYVQICGRRDDLQQSDLSKMQQNNANSNNGIYRFLGTYDFMLDRFRPLL